MNHIRFMIVPLLDIVVSLMNGTEASQITCFYVWLIANGIVVGFAILVDIGQRCFPLATRAVIRFVIKSTITCFGILCLVVGGFASCIYIVATVLSHAIGFEVLRPHIDALLLDLDMELLVSNVNEMMVSVAMILFMVFCSVWVYQLVGTIYTTRKTFLESARTNTE